MPQAPGTENSEMDGYASFAPDELLAESQRRERNARLAEQTGYVDWAGAVAPSRADGSPKPQNPQI